MFRRFSLLWLCLLPFATPAAAQQGEVQTSWRLLDYLAVDYPGAVRDGRVISASEYKEMGEFAASVGERIGGLPQKPQKARLVAGADALKAAIGRKAAPEDVARIAHGLAAQLIAAYPVPLAPKSIPDPARGDFLFAQNCAACHGAAGDGKGPMAAKLNPPPIAFADRERARQRSLFALYQVIDQGLEGTAMQSFSSLPDADKWALAFRVGRFAYPPALAEQGRKLWQSDATVRGLVPDAAALTGLTEAGLAQRIGPAKAAAVAAYLRNDPKAVGRQSGSSLTIVREKLRQSLAAYEAGDRNGAKELALAAYLDGFEPVEPMLAARDSGLLARVETKMGELRGAIAQGKDVAEVRERVSGLNTLVDESESALAPDQGSAASTFLGAFTILVREGLEALLIVVAMLAFLRKADRPEMARPVHWGWVLALLAGLATWWAATNLIAISGASRELTEGFGSALAAVVLLFVGIWMHGKAQADEWQRYIHDKVGQALSKKSAWFLFLLAFVAVYREVFETILFFAALSAEGRVGAVIAGAAAGLGTLALIAVLMLRFSRRLPIAKFFSYSSLLIAVLAVVLAGKGVAALQEAGMLGVTPASWAPRISLLGLYPTIEGLVAQGLTLAVLVVGFGRNRRPAKRLATA
ncbi:MAG: high-affinity iron transporter [Sphingomonadales bacterium]|jgi:high-affinity iron transporter|nr:high-affinity iron transporter [Sphingomonadales bacterium]